MKRTSRISPSYRHFMEVINSYDTQKQVDDVGSGIESIKGPIIVIIRHGKTEHNKLGLFTGWEDAPLAAEGTCDTSTYRYAFTHVSIHTPLLGSFLHHLLSHPDLYPLFSSLFFLLTQSTHNPISSDSNSIPMFTILIQSPRTFIHLSLSFTFLSHTLLSLTLSLSRT